VLTVHAHVPSGPTAIVTSITSSPGTVAVTTMKLSSFTRTPVTAAAQVEQNRRRVPSRRRGVAA
jgi:hypothetical protein